MFLAGGQRLFVAEDQQRLRGGLQAPFLERLPASKSASPVASIRNNPGNWQNSFGFISVVALDASR